MAKKILFAKAKVDEEERNIYCNDLDKEDYDSKYKGHLTCINGCKARVKLHRERIILSFLVHGIKKENYIIKIAHILLSIKELKVDRS